MRRHPLALAGIGILVLAALVLVLRDSAGTVGGLTTSDFARLSAGVALLIVVGGGLFLGGGIRPGTILRHAVVWLAIAFGLVLVYSYRGELTVLAYRMMNELTPSRPAVTTTAQGNTDLTVRRDLRGHFAVQGSVDGIATTFLIDTGASRLTITAATAAAAGLRSEELSFSLPVQTANGTLLMAPVELEAVAIGPIIFPNVAAFVAPEGALTSDLLGVNVLNRLDSYEVRGDEMVLRYRG